MKQSTFFIPLICLVACGSTPETIGETTHEVVNGTENTTAEFKATVSIYNDGGRCSGTFIHPNFVLTAAHCFPQCTATRTNACVTAEHDIIVDGSEQWTGINGPLYGTTVCDGFSACNTPGDGNRYHIDYVYFPKSSQYYLDTAPLDVAILHTRTRFPGQVIPVMGAKDLPSPSNLCSRYEGSRPYIVGFSDNDATLGTMRRRVGMTEVECDIEMESRAFKVDGDGGNFVGARGCKGDSGGPALWRDATGALQVGGVMSYTDEYNLGITDTNCPSAKGETGIAFIPRAFIDATVASLTVIKQGSAGTVTSTPDGISCTGEGSDCTEQYDVDTTVVLQAVPAPNTVFAGWSGACTGTAPTCQVTVTSALRVTANFATLTQPLTTRVAPTGTGSVRITPPNAVCSGTCTRSYNFGTNVSVTAVSAAGYVFANWVGSCAGTHSSTCNLAMTAARSATANFCPEGDACCLNPAACTSCNPKLCPKDDPYCC